MQIRDHISYRKAGHLRILSFSSILVDARKGPLIFRSHKRAISPASLQTTKFVQIFYVNEHTNKIKCKF